jgi:hypothetical protein
VDIVFSILVVKLPIMMLSSSSAISSLMLGPRYVGGGIAFVCFTRKIRLEGVESRPGDRVSSKLGELAVAGEFNGEDSGANEHSASRRSARLASSRTSAMSISRVWTTSA